MNTRTLTIMLALAAAWPVAGQDLGKKVSLTLPAVEVKEALRQLGAQTGLKFEASGRVTGEPLLLDVHDVTVQDLMPRIAAAMKAEWEKIPDGFRLTRSPALDRQQENAEVAARTAAIKKSLQRYLDEHQKMGQWDAETLAKLVDAEKKQRERTMKDIERNLAGDNAMMISMASNGSQTPAGTALYEVLKGISARDLAQIQPGARVVYSSNPTPMQRSTSFDARQAINRFVTAHNMLANAVANEPALPNKVTFQGGLDLQAKPIAGAVGKLLVIVTRQAADSPLTLHLKIADQSGKIIASSQAYVDVTETPTETKLPAPNKAIKLSEPADELVKLLREDGESSRSSVNVMEINGDRVVMSSGDPEVGKPISPALLDKLVHPDKVDPLSLFVSEALIQASAAKGTNLVASPPDAAFGAYAGILSKESNAGTVLGLVGQAGMTAEEKDGWLVLSPTTPYASRQGRMSRSALGNLLRSIVGAGYARLNEMGAYAASLPVYREEKGPDDHYLQVISPAAYRDYRDMLAVSEGMLVLYGMLSSEQRRVLESGQNLLARNLGPGPSAQVSNIIYNRPSGLPMIRGEGMAMMMSVSAGDEGGGPADFGSDSLSKEPTEIYPTGIPVLASLTLKVTPEEAVYSRLSGSRDGRFFTAGELGMMQGMAEREASTGNGIRPQNFTKFRSANLAKLEMKLSMNEKQNQSARLRDAWILPNTLDVAMDALPAAFLKKIRDAQERMRNIRVGEGSPPPAK